MSTSGAVCTCANLNNAGMLSGRLNDVAAVEPCKPSGTTLYCFQHSVHIVWLYCRCLQLCCKLTFVKLAALTITSKAATSA